MLQLQVGGACDGLLSSNDSEFVLFFGNSSAGCQARS